MDMSRKVTSTASRDTTTTVVVGKLFVTCVEKPEIPPWIYYLKANTHDKECIK